MEAILPLKISGDHQQFDLERAKILIYSLDHFWKGDEFKIHVVARDEDFFFVSRTLKANNIKILFYKETDIVPILSNHKSGSGWIKQQLIKLSAHKIIDSKFFITLDADLICIKDISDENFVVGGKALNDWESRYAHHEWWHGSARILNVSPNMDVFGLSVTPQILSTDICSNLEKNFSERHKSNLFDYLMTVHEIWTEYSLYTIFAETSGLLEKFHHLSDWIKEREISIKSLNNFWSREGYETWNPTPSFSEDDRGVFMICQSNSMIPPRDIWKKMEEIFPGSPFDAV